MKLILEIFVNFIFPKTLFEIKNQRVFVFQIYFDLFKNEILPKVTMLYVYMFYFFCCPGLSSMN